MGVSIDQALRNLGFGGGNQEAQKKQTKQKAALNASYSSQEFANKGDAGSDFFNQTKQRGTLFGN